MGFLVLWSVCLCALCADSKVDTARLKTFCAIGKERSDLNGFQEADKVQTIVVTSPMDYQVFQRQDRSKGTVTITGLAPLDCQVRFRWRGNSVDGPVSEDWISLPISADQHAFSMKSKLPSGGWYRLDVQAFKGKAVLSQTVIAHVGMGAVFVVSGQSNSTR
jgi:hypothetical protein